MSVGRSLIDGVLIGAGFAVVVLTSLLIDPFAWVGDYPPDVQAAVADSPPAGTAFRIVVAGALVTVIVVGLAWSLKRLGRANPTLGFRGAALHVFVVYWAVQAFDVFVIDWLFFMNLLHRWVVLPGTEGLAGYGDYWFHFRVSFLEAGPWLGSFVLSLAAASGWWLLRPPASRAPRS
jgi:hypothetical protein